MGIIDGQRAFVGPELVQIDLTLHRMLVPIPAFE
jgi:hypothetical protein